MDRGTDSRVTNLLIGNSIEENIIINKRILS